MEACTGDTVDMVGMEDMVDMGDTEGMEGTGDTEEDMVRACVVIL